MEAVIEWAATVGAQTVRLHVMAGNVPARLLYERCDFRGTGREVGGEGGGVVQVEMERTVSRPHTDEGRRPGG